MPGLAQGEEETEAQKNFRRKCKKLSEGDSEEEPFRINPASEMIKIYDQKREYKASFSLFNLHNDINVDFEDKHLIENDCMVCNFPESFSNCPTYSVGYHLSVCGHFESCKNGSCSCNQLEKMTSFLNLSISKTIR